MLHWQRSAVYGHVSIDSIAGPSEILGIWLMRQQIHAMWRRILLSQAEHDELASAILVTTSQDACRRRSLTEVDRFIKELSRGEIIRKSLDNYGYILVADTHGGSD